MLTQDNTAVYKMTLNRYLLTAVITANIVTGDL
jgi:hypothetical protein